MRNRILIALALSFAAMTPLAAQTPSGAAPAQFIVPPPSNPPSEQLPAPGVYSPPPPPSSSVPPSSSLPSAPPPPPPTLGPTLFQPAPMWPGDPVVVIPWRTSPDQYRIWFNADLLLWWVKNAPIPVPLVVATDSAGNSQMVFGNTGVDLGAIVGSRFAMGIWFDRENNIGMEVSGFTLGNNSRTYSFGSDGNGNPALSLSFANATPGSGGGEFLLPVSVPGQYAGVISVSSALQLWGTEVNGVFSILRTRDAERNRRLELTLLAGFRYADLREDLNINSVSNDLSANPTYTAINDDFSTHNQFYGGQLGARVYCQFDRLIVDLTGKIALGDTYQTVDIQGSTANFGATSGFSPGGLYAQSTNSGHFTGNQFTVMPAVELKVSYLVTPRLRIYAGYDFMYWNQVVRPGNQIDRNINLSQSTALGGSGTLTGPSSPMPLFNRTDFWAQGITFGVEFRF